MVADKIVLAYSGGLDTSCILKWLINKGHPVVCYMANVGQTEDFEAAKAKALKLGASQVVIEDLREEFVENYVWPAVSYGLVYESRYLLGTALARPCISVGLINCLKASTYWTIKRSHCRMAPPVRATTRCASSWPATPCCPMSSLSVQIIAPWRQADFVAQFSGRRELLQFAADNDIPVPVTPKAPWSMDANIMHTSYESGVLEDPDQEPPAELYLMTRPASEAPEQACRLAISFEKGRPVLLELEDGRKLTTSLDILETLNEIGGQHGVGRIDIVENRFLGLKSRGVYETPGVTILHQAHLDLETFCLDREVYRVKQLLKDRLADYVYNGFWFSPEVQFTRKCLDLAAENVQGTVKLQVHKGAVTVLGRSSSKAPYNADLVSMDQLVGFGPQDATGFIKIQAIRLREHQRLTH
ncbi:hypothetical protein D910_07019 [Dendroctonus ponderosae]